MKKLKIVAVVTIFFGGGHLLNKKLKGPTVGPNKTTSMNFKRKKANKVHKKTEVKRDLSKTKLNIMQEPLKRKETYNFSSLSNIRIEELIKEIDKRIAQKDLISKANSKIISKKEKKTFFSLLRKRDHLFQEKIKRLIKKIN